MRRQTRTNIGEQDWTAIRTGLPAAWPHIERRLYPVADRRDGKARRRGRPAFRDRQLIFEAFLWALFTGRSLRWMHGELGRYPPGVTVHRALTKWTDDEAVDEFAGTWRIYLSRSSARVQRAWCRVFKGAAATELDARHLTQRRRLHWYAVLRMITLDV